MTESLAKWVEVNKLIVSESLEGDLDIITIDGVGRFLYIQPTDGKVIDEDFAFILTDAQFDALDNKAVDFILFEFGTKFYYSTIKQDKNKYNELVYQPNFNDFKYLGACAEPHIMNFVHLGVHDEYELLSGSGACELWCKKAKFLGHTAIGVCNENSLASTLSFQTYAEKMNLKCIIGESIKVARNYNPDDDLQELFDLKLYVLNETGYHNLLLISKTINVDYDGFIPDTILYTYGEGLCCVVAKNSEINYLMNNDKVLEARKLAKKYKQVFSKVYYQIDTVEYSSNQLFREHLRNIDNYILNLRKVLPPLLINDSYYLDEEEWELKGYLSKISGKATPESPNQYFKSVSETINAYTDWLDDVEPLFEVITTGIANTDELVASIDWRINNSERKLPKFEVEDPEAMFFEELQKGIEAKLVGKVKNLDDYMARIQTECDLIVPNDLCSYFLILWDICNWCKENNIMVGPGRGSVCGSLVAYCLNITQIDPLKYQLYFERFLNPTRLEKQLIFHIKLENGAKFNLKDGFELPLVGGEVVKLTKDTDFSKLDVDFEKLSKATV